MIEVKKVNKTYGNKIILANISFSVNDGQKIALVGSNGAGKSTLLKIIAGTETPDSGLVKTYPDLRVGYLPQEIILNGEETIKQYFNRFCDNVAYYQIMEVLSCLGVGNIDLSRPMSSLSGGQKSKVALAGIILNDFDILLFDEPTNNLDLPALIWLEQYLKNLNKSYIIVSHDRRFLDNTTSRVLEINRDSQGVVLHTGSYSNYLELKEKELKRKIEEYLAQQEEIERLESAIDKNKNWATRGAKQESTDKDKRSRGYNRERSIKSASRAKAIEKRLEKIDKLEAPKQKIPLIIPLKAIDSRARHFILLKDVSIKFSSGFNLGPFSLEVPYGSRTAILGMNGSGKSSILKIITGFLKPVSGIVDIGSSLIIGDLMQEHENMPRDKSLIEFLREQSGVDEQESYYLLAKFGFEADEANKKIKEISPGGRARLLIALFSAKSVNVLILDEPTNHLDLEAVSALENLLETYTGTVILVSHDRYFLEKVKPEYIFVVEDGKVGSIKDYQGYINSMTKLAKKMLRML